MSSIVEGVAPPRSAPWDQRLPAALRASPALWLPPARNIDPCREASPPVLPPWFARHALLRVMLSVLWPRFIISKSVTIVPLNHGHFETVEWEGYQAVHLPRGPPATRRKHPPGPYDRKHVGE